MIAVEEERGRRLYCDGGLRVPSVTEVLANTGPRKWGLEQWRRNLGPAEAERVGEIAAARGRRMHREVAHYLATGEEPAEASIWWRSIWPTVRLLRRVARLELAEVPLVDPLRRYGGTPDAVLRVLARGSGGHLEVYDWKTSIERRSPEALEEYATQLAGYVGLVELQLGEAPRRAVIGVAVPEEPCQVVPVDLAKHSDMWSARLEEYHERFG